MHHTITNHNTHFMQKAAIQFWGKLPFINPCRLIQSSTYSHCVWKWFPELFAPYLPRDQSKAGWPAVSQFFLHSLLEDSHIIYSFPVFRNLPLSAQPSKDQKWPYNDISQFPQHTWVYPIQTHGYVLDKGSLKFPNLILIP